VKSSEGKCWKINGPTSIPGGDYGSILHAGIFLGEGERGIMKYGRTGPYIPNIAFPSIYKTVVTGSFKDAAEKSGLSGFEFKPIILTKLVELDWKHWDRITWRYPSDVGCGKNDGPSDYITEGAHSARLAQAIGQLWEMECANKSSAEWLDFFCLTDHNGKFCTQRGMDWLERLFSADVTFRNID